MRWAAGLFFGILLEAQSLRFPIVAVEVYGGAAVDRGKLREALPYRVGQMFEPKSEASLERMPRRVRQLVGKNAFSVGLVYDPGMKGWLIYVDVEPERGEREWLPRPTGAQKLPPEMVRYYEKLMDVGPKMGAEDDSAGYAWFQGAEEPQVALRDWAKAHPERVMEALREAAADGERAAAAWMVAYLRGVPGQVEALGRATRDSNSTVRNNALRALGVLARVAPAELARMDFSGLLAGLESLNWTDRNKTLMVLSGVKLTPEALGELRGKYSKALEEMAQWKSMGHAGMALELVGRARCMEEGEMAEKIAKEDRQGILAAANRCQ